MSQCLSAIILMGGKGERFGSTFPKQFHNLAGKPVFIHTIERFIFSRFFKELVLVCPMEWMTFVEAKIVDIKSEIPIKIVKGGATRRESSYKGLQSVQVGTTHVVIHDAVRPFVSEKIIKDNVENVIKHGAVDTCISSTDTIVHSLDKSYIESIPAREQYLRGQTPQSFYLPTILEAHEKAIKDSYSEATDDCSLLARIGKDVFIVEGDEHNIKITTELDLFLAEQILRLSQKATQSKNIQNVKNKTYVVTGGTGGIGSAICSKLESIGAKAIPISKNSKEYQANLCNLEQVQKIFEEIHLQYGKIDGLINCIGRMIYQPFKTLDPKQIIDLVETNLIASLYCCKYAQINSGGHILNITSSSYFKGRKNYAVYSACKAAIVNFTQGLSEELPDLCVNAFAPQRTLTPLRLLNFPSEPFDHLLDKEDVATSVVQILSEHNLTGSIFDLRKSYTHMGSQDSDTNRKLQPII